VKQTPGSIGYVELAYAKQNKLSMASVRNRAGNFVEPNLASTTAAVASAAARLAKDVRAPIVNGGKGEAYPIAGLTFLLVYQDEKDAGKQKALANFIDWAIHDGQQYAESLDYAKLPDDLVHVNEANLKLLTSAGKKVRA
jgi:phosphate transport system substrate-binding protein